VVPLLSADQLTLAHRVLQPVQALGYRIRGVVSDDEKALLRAVAQVWPGVAQQTCQLHCLQDAATPIQAADQTLKKALKKAGRASFYTVCRALSQLPPDDPRHAVLTTYAELIRAILTAGSKPPLALGGLRVFEDLTRLDASLHRSRNKGATRSWINSRRWSNAAPPSRRSTGASNANAAGWWNWIGSWTHPKTRDRAQPGAVSSGASRTSWSNWKRMPSATPPRPRWSRISVPPCDTAGRACLPAMPGLNATGLTTMETFFGRLRTRQRQIHGRKSVHEFILRYGEWAVFIDPTETFAQVLGRFQHFDQAEFDQEHERFQKAQRRLQVLYRFRHHPRRCLKQLEQQWAKAIRRKSR
jgi:hypothetical protein